MNMGRNATNECEPVHIHRNVVFGMNECLPMARKNVIGNVRTGSALA
jgi:hypothetical protein